MLNYSKEINNKDILKSKDNSILSKNIADKIHENYKEFKLNPTTENKYLINIQNIASEIGISTSKMLKSFKESYGMSPKDYLSFIRLNDAKSMLVHSHLSIENIGQMIGFDNVSNFSKQFKIWCNETPSQYRNKFSNDSNK